MAAGEINEVKCYSDELNTSDYDAVRIVNQFTMYPGSTADMSGARVGISAFKYWGGNLTLPTGSVWVAA